MENVKTIAELVEYFEANNYYYRGQKFNNRSEFEEAAINNYDGIVNEEDVVIYVAKSQKFYIDELNDVVELVEFESHFGDSGVPAEDYFYGYVINEL